MRLYLNQLDQHLRGQLSPVYLVAGNDILLCQEACQNIKQAALAQGYQSEGVETADSNFKWSSLIDSANSLSLFSEKVFAEIKMPSSKIGNEGSAAIVDYLQNPPEDRILLLSTTQVSGKPKWLNKITDCGTCVSIYPLDQNKVPGWIAQRGKTEGILLDKHAAIALAERTEGNLSAAAQEISKLALIHEPNSTISAEDIDNAVTENSRFSPFSMLDHCINRQAEPAIKAIRGLREEGTALPALIGAVANQLRNYIVLKQAQEQGNIDSAHNKIRTLPKRKAALSRFIGQQELSAFNSCIQLLSRADFASKDSRDTEAWAIIELVILQLCGINSQLSALYLERN